MEKKILKPEDKYEVSGKVLMEIIRIIGKIPAEQSAYGYIMLLEELKTQLK